jgi:hypothetical protein
VFFPGAMTSISLACLVNQNYCNNHAFADYAAYAEGNVQKSKQPRFFRD